MFVAKQSRHGFTIVEVLVVVAALGLLIGLAIPAIQSSREAARCAQCINNLKQLGLAHTQFESRNQAFASQETTHFTGPLLKDPVVVIRDYMVDLLPFLEESNLHDQYRKDLMFCAPENAAVASTRLATLICPSAPNNDDAPKWEFVPSIRNHQMDVEMRFGAGNGPTVLGPIMTPEERERELELGRAYQKYIKLVDGKYTTSYAGARTDYAVPVNADWNLAERLGYKRVPDSGLQGIFKSPRLNPLMRERWAAILNVPGEAIYSAQTTAAQIVDGLSQTFLMTEVAGRPDRWEMGVCTQRTAPVLSPWADPFSASFGILGTKVNNTTCLMQCDNAGEIYSFHPGGVNFVFADGHVETLSKSTDPRLILAILTPNQGDNHAQVAR